METFGLLDFLLPLLDFTKKSPQKEQEQSGGNSQDFPSQNTQNANDFPLEKHEENALKEQKNATDFSSQNAILAFYQAHETRAKRTRK